MSSKHKENSLLSVEDETQLRALLEERFMSDNFYSFIDDILLSINPCKNTDTDHEDNMQWLFQHIANSTVNQLRHDDKSQCIILTGESGAGKTELANQIIRSITKETSLPENELTKYITQAEKVLESFGNACSARNPNSSRFVKLTELFLTENCLLKGVYFHHFLLDKSRIVNQNEGEKNFHIFNQLFGGTSQENLHKFYLSLDDKHRCIDIDIESKDKREELTNQLCIVEESLISLGFHKNNIDTIFRVLAAIVHICDLTVTMTTDKKKSVRINELDILAKASTLLGVTPERLQFSLLTEMTLQKGRIARRVRSLKEVINARDMLAMSLYTRLFAWIIWSINQFLAPFDDTRGREVSILDPFGFENLDVNNMDQLIVNSTSEHLKFLYTQVVFSWELADQEAEGILIQKLHYQDNKMTIDFLMERPDGLFALIEKESKSLKKSDGDFVKKISSKHRKSPCYSDVSGSSSLEFAVNHYAGKVVYSGVEILTKNKDMLGGSLITCLQESEDDIIHRLFKVKLSSTGAIIRAGQRSVQDVPLMPRKAEIKKMRRTQRRQVEMISNIHGISNNKAAKKRLVEEQANLTLTSRFRNSLSDLMQRNLQSEMHFVICVRPNQNLEAHEYDDDLVTAQLRYSGVMEAISMRQQGFPARYGFKEFIERYKILSFRLTVFVSFNGDVCEKILSKVDGLDWKIGKTKVFMKNTCKKQLNNLLDTTLRRIVIIQKLHRGRSVRKHFRRLKFEYQKQKENMACFLSQVEKSLENVLSHLCYQVNEENLQAKSTDKHAGDLFKEKALQILDGRKPVQTARKTSGNTKPKLDAKSDANSGDLEMNTPLDQALTSAAMTTDQSGFVGNLTERNLSPGSRNSPLASMSDIFSDSTDGEVFSTSQFRSSSEDIQDIDDLPSEGGCSITDLFDDNLPDDNDGPSADPVFCDDVMAEGELDDIASPMRKEFVTSPVRPSLTGRESNLSTFSFDSVLSPDDDMEGISIDSPGLWCVITCYERDLPRGEFPVDRSVMIVDGSSNPFDVTRIGIGSLPMNPSDEKVEKTRRCIGRGIKLTVDAEGNMWVKRTSKNKVFVKGCFLSDDTKDSEGELPKGKLIKVFDYEAFSSKLQYQCDPMRYEPGVAEELLSASFVYFSFVKNAIEDVDIPCWIGVRMVEPYRVTEVALEIAKDRRRIEREKRGEQTPPILRAKIGKSRQVIAVGAFEKMVRPKRYVDSFKYGRKGWARKKVSVNPFEFGSQDMFAANEDQRGRTLSSPEDLLGRHGEAQVTCLDDVFTSKPKVAMPTNVVDGKVWAKDNLKTREMQLMKGRVRSKTTSGS